MQTTILGTVLGVRQEKSKKDGNPFGIAKVFDGSDVTDVLVNVSDIVPMSGHVGSSDPIEIPVNINAGLDQQGRPVLRVSKIRGSK